MSVGALFREARLEAVLSDTRHHDGWNAYARVIANGALYTLRSIRSGGNTDAFIAGVPEPERLATGGWQTVRGAATYLDRAYATLSSPGPGGFGAGTQARATSGHAGGGYMSAPGYPGS